jgi:two-component sensor histidine kinase
VAVLLWHRKVHSARLLVAGWLFAVLGWSVFGLEDTGMLSAAPSWLPYFYETTIFAEAILFSMALASKLNLTGELQSALRRNELLLGELNHRVKNNMQLILSLYRIKLHGLRCPGLDEKLREIEEAVQSMRSIHESLYMAEKGDTVDLAGQLHMLTENLRRGFRRDDVEIDLDVEGKAEISEALLIGLIVNELVVNAFRHGLTDRNGRIRLTLQTGEGMRRLVVEDDGKGCEKSVMAHGYGLELVRAIVEGELKGTLRIASEKGCRIEMAWKPFSTPGLSPA